MDHDPVILFDGVCNLCSKAVQFILKNDTEGRFMLASLQSNFGQAFLSKNHFKKEEFDTIILIVNDQIFYSKSKAVFEIAKNLPKYSWLSFFSFLPTFITDVVYSFISKNRLNWFGKLDVCWLPNPAYAARFLN